MPDTGRLRRVDPDSDEPTFDQATNTETESYATVYTGRGRSIPQLSPNVEAVAEQSVAQQRYLCAIPWDAAPPQPGDQWITDTSADPQMVGRVLIVRSVPASSYATCRHFVAIDQQDPRAT